VEIADEYAVNPYGLLCLVLQRGLKQIEQQIRRVGIVGPIADMPSRENRDRFSGVAIEDVKINTHLDTIGRSFTDTHDHIYAEGKCQRDA
jgi:hypothetical protein